MAHTSGPWRADVSFVNGPRDYGYDAATGEFSSIAQAFGRDAEANARLIAAAPDLLDACKQAFRIGEGEVLCLVGEDDGTCLRRNVRESQEALRAAIAKAEGR